MSNFLSILGFTDEGLGSDRVGSVFSRKGSRGFTLVELLVVIAIISILATLLLLQLGVARAKARDAKRIADVNQVRSALELYFDDNGSYMATNVMTGLKPTYLINVPNDPIATCTAGTYNGLAGAGFNCYGYEWKPLVGPTSFQVWAELENNNRNALTNDTDINSTGWAGGGAEVDGRGAPSTGEACVAGTSTDCIYDSGQP